MKPKRKPRNPSSRSDTGIRSASGKGTISRTESLGWAFKNNKQDPDGCVYIEKTAKEPATKSSEPGCFTFDEWSAAGYRVCKGAKSRSRNADHVPLFGLDQVWTSDKKARPPVAKKPSKKPSKSTPVPKSCPPVKQPWTDWSQPSGLVKEVLGRMARKEETEDAAHMHMPESFETNDDDYKDLPY